MADYRGIKGFKVQSLSSDPTTSGITSGSWASGGNMNTSRGYIRGFGTQTAAMATGGSGPTTWLLTEEYNGTAWSEESADLNTGAKGRGHHGFLQTAGLIYGGEDAPTTVTGATESYNGSAWTEVNDLNNARKYLAGAGSSTANLAFGGFPPAKAECESWDGSSWTEVNNLNSAAYSLSGAGSQTAAIRCGGVPGTQLVETWDGTSWTETTDFSNARSQASMTGGQPSNTSQLIMGGSPAPGVGTLVEWWDGSSWSEVPAMSNQRESSAGAGTDISALAAGDDSPGVQSEEFTSGSSYSNRIPGQLYFNTTSNVLKYVADPTAPAGTWSTGGALNTGRFPLGSARNAPAPSTALAFGGGSPPYTGATESYDGSSWTELNDLNDPRIALGGAGTATAALAFGGDSPGYPTATESWDGTNWTVVPATLTEGKDNAASFGTQTAAIFATGYAGPPAGPTGNTTNVNSYDGSAWTEVNNVNTARSYVQGCGTQTSGIIAGGSAPPYSALAETWDGTSWTEVADLNTARANFSTFGTQTNAIGSGGDDGSTPRFAITEAYDGSSWAEVADLNTATKMSASSATTGTVGLNFGGSDPGNNPQTRTELFEVPSTATLKTVTGA
jgi:hypothetical protein